MRALSSEVGEGGKEVGRGGLLAGGRYLRLGLGLRLKRLGLGWETFVPAGCPRTRLELDLLLTTAL